MTTTIADLADAYAINEPSLSRDEHFAYLTEAAQELNIPLDAELTDEMVEAIETQLVAA